MGEVELEHWCNGVRYQGGMCCERGQWRLGNKQHSTWWAITYCPYCGEKLELPDVKIEVSRKTLDTWHACLFRAHAVLTQNLGRLRADADVLAVLNEMKVILND